MTEVLVTGSHYIFKNASITATVGGLGIVSGLILDALILSAFGVGSQTDAFFTALTVPLLISNVFSIQGPKVLIRYLANRFGTMTTPLHGTY